MKDDFFYRKLIVYQRAMDLVTEIYELLRTFPQEPSNIAEGMSRFSNKEKIQFLNISNGSLMEIMCQTEIAKRIGYVSQEEYLHIEKNVSEIAYMLSSLRKKITNS